ncbi:hypothetical protein G9P44_001379 [Scheffersomyces stipitis]|nr:hypothetical protein G9P44_001379 [Scheffersomyces stipitis]
MSSFGSYRMFSSPYSYYESIDNESLAAIASPKPVSDSNDYEMESSPTPTPTATPSKPTSALFSSPVSSVASQQRPRNVVDDLHEIQQERSVRMLKPLSTSSPIRQGLSSSSPIAPRNRTYHHHQDEIDSRCKTVNLRNKHNKLRQVRNQYKQDKIMLQRSRVNDLQFQEDFKKKYDLDYNEMVAGYDLDQLIEDERESEAQYAEIVAYERELEIMAMEEELEIAEMLEMMNIADA